ncbi:MAG: hypothetical protein RR504_07330 [Christensenellaceae bacterium]
MNNLGSLIKNYLLDSFGFNKAKYTTDSKVKNKNTGYTILMVVVFAILITTVFGMCMGMAKSLKTIDALYILPTIMMTAASLMALFTTIYKTNGLLFGFRDFDTLMSLPIKTSTIITSRLLILYGMNFVFTLMLMLPCGVAYGIVGQPPFAFYLIFIVTLLFIPLIPIVLATIIGSLIALAASRFKRKNGMNVVFTLVLFLVIFFASSQMNNLALNFADIGATVFHAITRAYPLAALYSSAISSFNVLALFGFLAISAAAFVLFVWVVSKNFKRINTAITTNRTISNYKMQALKQSSPAKALYSRELKRYFSSSQYVLNTAIGLALMTILSVFLLIVGLDKVEQLLSLPGFSKILIVIAPLFLSAFIAMSCTTSSSISLEGKTLWIVKSLPISTKSILLSKIFVNLTLLVPAILINSTIFCIVLQASPVSSIMMFLTPLVYALFTAFFGLWLNLKSANFEWTSEVVVIKNSGPATISVLVGMVLTIIPGVLTLLFGGIVILLFSIAMAVVDVILYKKIVTKGIQIFDSF